MRPGIDPKVDYAFKRVFGSESNRDVLVDLLNAVLQFGPGREVVEVEILNPFNDKEFADDKLSVVDVKARDAVGRMFAVEMQMLARADHRQRLLYYATRLYSQQLVEGDAYDRLKPAYLISFVNSRVIADSPSFHTRFVLRDLDHNLTFTDDFAVHMIELPKFLAVAGGLSDRLDSWCYFLRNADTLDTDSLPSALAVPAIQKAMETLSMISEIERERQAYESRWRRDLEHRSAMADFDRLKREVEEGQRSLLEGQRAVEEGQRAVEEAQRSLLEEQRAVEEGRRKLTEQQRAVEERRRQAEQKERELTERATRLEAVERGMLVSQIQAAMIILSRSGIGRDELFAHPIEELRVMAAQLEAETQGGP